MSNPSLLDDLFDDQASSPKTAIIIEPTSPSSSSGDDYEEMAEKIISTSSMHAKWIPHGETKFFYNSKELILLKNNCYFKYQGDGVFQFLKPAELNGDPVMTEISHTSIEPMGPLVVTKLVRSELELVRPESKSTNFQELLNSIPAINSFFQKWNLQKEESICRHFIKLDSLLVSYIIERFNPQKSKPKNALQKFIDTLTKHPQRWRPTSIRETGFGELIQLSKDDELVPGVKVVILGQSYYVLVQSSEVTVLMDGIRIIPSDGPSELVDGSVISISNVKDFIIPDFMFVVGDPKVWKKQRVEVEEQDEAEKIEIN